MKKIVSLIAISIFAYSPLTHSIEVYKWGDGTVQAHFSGRRPSAVSDLEFQWLSTAIDVMTPAGANHGFGDSGGGGESGARGGDTASTDNDISNVPPPAELPSTEQSVIASPTQATPPIPSPPASTDTFKTVGAQGDVGYQDRAPQSGFEQLAQGEKISVDTSDAPEDAAQPPRAGFVITPNAPLKAFPTAEGFGATTRAGRGGRLIEVTNLNDSGPGSLREAIRSIGPRIVVFRVGGTIELEKRIKIYGKNAYLTIAGQTAPGGGIQLKNYGLELQKGAHDLVVRHLRIRPGLSSKDGKLDAVTIYDKAGSHIHHVVFDHVTMEWGIDENAGHGGWVTDVTYQWCIFAEGTSKAESGHSSKGLLVVGDNINTSNISVHHSLFAHNSIRSPMIKGALADFRNNLVYNWGPWSSSVTRARDKAQVNIVNNHYIQGPDSLKDVVIYVENNSKVHVTGNISPRCPTPCINPWAVGIVDEDELGNFKRDLPFFVPAVTTDPTAEIKKLVLAGAGATLPTRDAVDRRIAEEVLNTTGSVGIGSGYPILRSGTPPSDFDRDGMPDDWELLYGLDPKDPSDGNGDLDGDGYTNVEEYLNELASRANP